MATKIGGDQLRLEDFIKNPTPNGDWSSTLFTASLAAIKALVTASGIPELSGYVKLWEVADGFYITRGLQYDISQHSPSYKDGNGGFIFIVTQGNNKLFVKMNEYGEVVVGTSSRTGGSINILNIKEFQAATSKRAGENGIVPAPQAGDNEKFLKGDGTWGEPDVFDGATSSAAGQKGAVPAPQAGDNEKFLKGDGTWGEPNVFDGATSSAAGQKGSVPAPQAGDNEKFLKGDGTWGEPDVFDGATSSAAGQKGAVPAPQAGDQGKFLKGDGTWGEPDVFDGATSSAAGQKGAVPAPQAGDNEKFLKGDGTWGEPNVFDGATSSAAGQKGSVPAPQAGDQGKFLKGDGTWGEPNVFDGATSSAAGQKGSVPAPQAGDQEKFLKGDGTWGPSPKFLKITFANVYDTIHHIDYWVPKKTETTFYTNNELKQLLDEGYMLIAIAGTSSAAGNWYYPDQRWDGQTSNRILFRKTGVEYGAFISRRLELSSTDYPGYEEIWEINTEFSINI